MCIASWVLGDVVTGEIWCGQMQVVCELPELQTAQGAPVWGQLLAGLLKGLEQREVELGNGVGDVPDNLEDLAEENQVLIQFLAPEV